MEYGAAEALREKPDFVILDLNLPNVPVSEVSNTSEQLVGSFRDADNHKRGSRLRCLLNW